MNKKQFALSAAAFAVALALVSCEPLRGCAAEIGYDEQAGIYDYLDSGHTALFNIDFQLDEDEDGNRSKRVQIYALQNLALTEQFRIYDNIDFSIAPDTVTVSGSGTSGLYRSYKDNQIHAMTYTPPPTRSIKAPFSIPLYSSDEFSVSLNAISPTWIWSISPYYQVSNDRYGVTIYIDMYQGMYANPHYTVSDSMGYFNTYTYNSSGIAYSDSKFMCIGRNQIPTLTANSIASAMQYNSNDYIGGLGTEISLPSGTVDTGKPWEYYNNVLLPYIQQRFPDVPNLPDYLIFPDGYQEPEQPTTVPVVYPTMPGFDFALETNGTEPPSDVNYNIPDLPGKNIAVPSFDFTQINPAEVMAPVAGGLRGIWELIGMVLTEYGLFPYVGLAIFAAIVAWLLRLGK